MMTTKSLLMTLAAVVFAACAHAPENGPVSLAANAAQQGAVPQGVSPGVVVTGLAPGATVRVHALRPMERWAPGADGAWAPQRVVLHAWAEFTADRRGEIDVDTTEPLRGTWRAPGSLGLFWSGAPIGEGALAAPPGLDASATPVGEIVVAVESQGALLTPPAPLRLVAETSDLAIESIAASGLRGAFAAPVGASALPLVIVLHGSEGSTDQTARAAAALYARQGFAALALSYYTPPWTPMAGVPTEAVNVPVEQLEAARAWAAARPEVDAARIGVQGFSKGAEFALVAASHYPWIDAVVACAPSHVVWEGFGRAIAPNEVASTWSIAGQPLPYVRYVSEFGAFVAANPGARAIDWHRASLDAAGAMGQAAAAIPVEAIQGRALLIGSGLDEVWPSGAMAEMAAQRMADRGAGERVESLIFPKANHQICGPGDAPTRLGAAAPGPGVADPTDVGEASVTAWAATIAFLRRELGLSP